MDLSLNIHLKSAVNEQEDSIVLILDGRLLIDMLDSRRQSHLDFSGINGGSNPSFLSLFLIEKFLKFSFTCNLKSK